MGNKLFCSDDKKEAPSNKKDAMMNVVEDVSQSNGAASASSDHSSSSPVKNNINKLSIPSDRTVDYPLEVFAQLAKTKHLPVFDSTTASIDYKAHDYRAFCLLLHKHHGAILLHCTRKQPKKPPHYQLPGGHVDLQEFEAVLQNSNSNSSRCTPQQLFLAARAACAREIYEETTIDLRDEQKNIDRLLPMVLRNKDNSDDNKLCNEFKGRLFFVAQVSDRDFASNRNNPKGSVRYQTLPQGGGGNCNLMLQLSVEHSGFKFAKEPSEIIQELQLHSGGKVSKALAMAYNVDIDGDSSTL